MQNRRIHLVLSVATPAFILAFIVHFASPAFASHFSSDDFMNLHYSWSRPLSDLIRSNLLFATTYYRPMGGAFYLGIYSLFGLNPLPFHSAAFALMLADTFLCYSCARRLSGSREVGALAALMSSFHTGMVHLYLETPMIYDVLCYFFYYGALLFYLRARQQGRRLRWWESGVFLVLYIAAMDSKEMAVSLPALVLLYELLWHPPIAATAHAIAGWLRREALPGIVAAALTLVYIAGKTNGAGSLANLDPYKPHISWRGYLESTGHYMDILFFRTQFFGWRGAAGCLAGMLVAAVLVRRRELLWSMGLILIGILPVAFIDPRGGFAIYVVSFGWALYTASLLVLLRTKIVSLLVREPRESVVAALQAVLFLAVAWTLYVHNDKSIRSHVAILNRQFTTVRHAVASFQELLPALPHSSRILVLDDPIPKEFWTLELMVPLLHNDRTLYLHRVKKLGPLAPEHRKLFRYVMEYRDGKYCLVAPVRRCAG